jgi:hypothetical protein
MNRTAPFNHRELFAIACMAVERLARYRQGPATEVCNELHAIKERCDQAIADQLSEGVTGKRPPKPADHGRLRP